MLYKNYNKFAWLPFSKLRKYDFVSTYSYKTVLFI